MIGFLIQIETQTAPFESQWPPKGTKKVPFWLEWNWKFEVSKKVDSGVVSTKRQIRVEVEIVTKTGSPVGLQKTSKLQKTWKIYIQVIKKEVIDFSMLF